MVLPPYEKYNPNYKSANASNAKISLKEIAEFYNIPLPSKQNQRDTFDFETDKRVDPEL